MNIRNQIDPTHPRSTFPITYIMANTHPKKCFHCGKQLTDETGVSLTHWMEYTHNETKEVHNVCDPEFDTNKDNAIHDPSWAVTGEYIKGDGESE